MVMHSATECNEAFRVGFVTLGMFSISSMRALAVYVSIAIIMN